MRFLNVDDPLKTEALLRGEHDVRNAAEVYTFGRPFVKGVKPDELPKQLPPEALEHAAEGRVAKVRAPEGTAILQGMLMTAMRIVEVEGIDSDFARKELWRSNVPIIDTRFDKPPIQQRRRVSSIAVRRILKARQLARGK